MPQPANQAVQAAQESLQQAQAIQQQLQSTMNAAPQPQGQTLGRAIRLAGSDLDWLGSTPPQLREADLSSIHVLSPSPGNDKDDKQQDILEHCRDTAKLVKQLASVLKGLEADVDSLRKENYSLRKTMQHQAGPEQSVPDAGGRFSLTATATDQPTEQDDERTIIAASSQSSLQHPNPLQTRSTPPPSARLAQPALAAQERMLMHASPHFGQPGAALPNKAMVPVSVQPQTVAQPQTPSPSKRSSLPSAGGQPLGGSRGPTLQPPGGGDWTGSPTLDVSPALDSTATIGGPCAAQDTSALADITAIPMSPPEGIPEQGATIGPWSDEQRIWLGGDGSAQRLTGKVRILDKDTIISASAAVEGLNRGSFKCDDDLCVVYSASSRGYYLLYRQGQRDKALALSSGEEPRGERLPQRNPGGPTHSACAVRVAAPQPSAGANAAGASDSADPVQAAIQLCANNEPERAEELLRKIDMPSEACFEALILAYDRCGNAAKAEEYLWRALQGGVVPGEASFIAIINAGCMQGAALKVEDTITQMMHLRIRPPKEAFDKVINTFTEQKNAAKVEEWLLNAGQSGWTPAQPAFEAVVNLYGEEDSVKAEEWLRRSQETEYRLADECYTGTAMSFVRAGEPTKAEEVLALMRSTGRTPSDSAIAEVLELHAEQGNLARAEFLLEQLPGSTNLDDLRAHVLDAAVRAGAVDIAERQLLCLGEPDAARALQVANMLAERGETMRAKHVLEQYLQLGGENHPDICSTLLSVSAILGDTAATEEAAQLLMACGPLNLNEMQVSRLRHALGDERAEALLRDGGAASGSPTGSRRTGREANTSGPGMRQPSQLSTSGSSRRTSQQRPGPASGKLQAPKSPSSSPGGTKAGAGPKAAAGPRRSGPTATTARGRTGMNTR